VEDGRIARYQVDLLVTFVLEDTRLERAGE
jgi:flavin-binding protein dodecin